MIDVLHIVRHRADDAALDQARRGGQAHALLLLGDAVASCPPAGVRCFHSQADAAARGVRPPGEGLADAAVLDLIFSAHRVVSW